MTDTPGQTPPSPPQSPVASGPPDPPGPPREPATVVDRSLPFLEATGFLGIALIVAAGMAVMGDDWPADRLNSGVLTLLLLAGGFVIRHVARTLAIGRPGIHRLNGVLWYAAVFGLGYFVFTWKPQPDYGNVMAGDFSFTPPPPITKQGIFLLATALSLVLAIILYWLRHSRLQNLALFSASVVFLAAAGDKWLGGRTAQMILLLIFGVAWLLLTRSEKLEPRDQSYALGALAVVLAPEAMLQDGSKVGLGVGLFAAAVLALVGVLGRRMPLFALGLVGAFYYLVWMVSEQSSLTGLVVGFLIAGVALVAMAVLAKRRRTSLGFPDGAYRREEEPAPDDQIALTLSIIALSIGIFYGFLLYSVLFAFGG